jgi:hypothetical protein
MSTLIAPVAARFAAQKRGLIAAPKPRPLPEKRPRRSPDGHHQFNILLSLLGQTCPEAFTEPPMPLAIGIYHQIIEVVADQFEADIIRGVLGWWTSRPDYLQALAQGGYRVGLDGSAAGEVAADHQQHAAERLEHRRHRRGGSS